MEQAASSDSQTNLTFDDDLSASFLSPSSTESTITRTVIENEDDYQEKLKRECDREYEAGYKAGKRKCLKDTMQLLQEKQDQLSSCHTTSIM